MPSHNSNGDMISYRAKKRPSGMGLRRMFGVSRAARPVPVTEQPEVKSISRLPKPKQKRIDLPQLPATSTVCVEKLYKWTADSCDQSAGWQNVLIPRKYTVEFSEDIDKMDNPEQVYMLCLLDLASRQYQNLGSFFMFLGFELRHTEIPFTICLPYKPIDAIDEMLLANKLEELRADYGGLPTITHTNFSVILSFVKRLTGSGRPSPGRRSPNSLEPSIKKKTERARKVNVTQNEVRSYCLGTAVLQGIRYLTHLEYSTDYQKEQRWLECCLLDENNESSKPFIQSAREMLLSAGITKSKDFTCEDVATLQNHFEGKYQLVLFSDSHDRSPIFKGPTLMGKNIIALVCKDGHYQHIQKLSTFLNVKFYCVHCNVRYQSEQSHYSCPLRCRLCTFYECYAEKYFEKQCKDCNVTFYSEKCFTNHLLALSGGRSRCQLTITCDKCGKNIMAKATHDCNNTFCKKCLRNMPRGHQCVLTRVLTSDGRIGSQHIVFHVECERVTLSDGVLSLRPVMAMALRCCPECSSSIPAKLEMAIGMTCTACSHGGQRLWVSERVQPDNVDKDVMSDLLKFIIHKDHRKLTAYSHDMPACVSDYILEYLTRPEVPQLKTISIEAGRLKYAVIDKSETRILDTKFIIPTHIDDLAMSLGLPDLNKGPFPRSFIRSEYFHYVGGLPPLEYYLHGGMNAEEKLSVSQWHAAKSAEHTPFHFLDELYRFCFSNLARQAATLELLGSGASKVLGIRIFDECHDVRSVAMRSYRRKFMLEETFPLDMGVTYKLRQTYSNDALRYLAWRAHREGITIDTAGNVGEWRVPGTNFHLDGFIHPCERYPRGLAIDVKGCYWHAHGCSTIPHMNPTRKANIPEIREKDAIREEVVRSMYDLDVVWMCEIPTMQNADKEMDDFVKNYELTGQIDICNALFPLRSETLRVREQLEPDSQDAIFVKDISALAITAMKYDQYPTGKFRRLHAETFGCPISSRQQLRDAVMGALFCQVVPPASLHLPVLPCKMYGNVVYTLCRSCSELNASSSTSCSHNDEERSLTGTWTSFELELALDYGYVIIKVLGALHWSSWLQYQRDGDKISHGALSAYTDALHTMETMAAGCPTDSQSVADELFEKEGVRIDSSLIQHNPHVHKAAHMLRCLWEVMAEQNERPTTKVAHSSGDLWKELEDTTSEVKELKVVSEGKVYVATGKLPESTDPGVQSVSTVSALTAAHARVRLYQAIMMIPEQEQNLIYMDDSILIYRAKRDIDPLAGIRGMRDSDKSGLVREFVSSGPGKISIAWGKSENDNQIFVKKPGFILANSSSVQSRATAMEERVRKLMAGEGEQVDVQCQEIKQNAHHILFSTSTKRRVRSSLGSRMIVPSSSKGYTIPQGFRL